MAARRKKTKDPQPASGASTPASMPQSQPDAIDSEMIEPRMAGMPADEHEAGVNLVLNCSVHPREVDHRPLLENSQTQEAGPKADDPAAQFAPAALEAKGSPAAEGEHGPRKAFQPGQFKLDTISLGAGKDAPKMDLFRSKQFKQMAVRFDQNPRAKYTRMLSDDGFIYRAAEGVWAKQLGPDAQWKRQADAGRLFRTIGGAIRAERGLEPFQAVGV